MSRWRAKSISRGPPQACNVTQPTLSGRIRQLELELGVPIVERGQRYQGLTQEGERVLKWAQLILNNWASMHQELAHLATSDFGLTGRLALGGIPSALPMIPLPHEGRAAPASAHQLHYYVAELGRDLARAR